MDNLLISIIIPAFQEEKRIGETIKVLSSYLDRKFPSSEIIVVCDGCTDNTAAIARSSFCASKCSLKVIELSQNAGKGHAVKTGVKDARGKYIIFTDADMSFSAETLEEFLPSLDAGADVVIAQRNKEIKYPGLGRRMVAASSRFLVGNFLLPGIRDSQAGYKAFSRTAAHGLFNRILTKKFLFDLELLLIAKRKNYSIVRVYVDWIDRPGSTFRILPDLFYSLRDLMIIYLSLITGKYD